MTDSLPGLLVAVALAAAATALAPFVPGVGAVVLALLLGAALGNAGLADGRLAPGLGWAERQLLAVVIGLLGFGLDVRAVVALGAVALPVLVGMVALTVAAAAWAGPRWFGLSPELSVLVGAGQGICGTAAVAAVAPVVRARDEDTGVAVGVINLLGTLGLIALPAGVVALGLSTEAAGLVLGGSLQSVGHAVAAGFGVSEEVGRSATAVKLGRVALLPLVLAALSVRGGLGGARVRLPPEVLAFAVASVLASSGAVPSAVLAALEALSQALLTVAMAAIGSRVRLAALRVAGAGALALGGALFVAQVAATALVGVWIGAE